MAWPDLPTEVHQSLKVLCSLARASHPLKAGQIARLDQIPPAQAAKVLQHLTWAGFVRSRRGMKGGYWLELPAGRIRVGDVLDSFGPRSRARKSKSNEVAKAVKKVTEPARKAFERITIADISHIGSKQIIIKEATDEVPSRAVR